LAGAEGNALLSPQARFTLQMPARHVIPAGLFPPRLPLGVQERTMFELGVVVKALTGLALWASVGLAGLWDPVKPYLAWLGPAPQAWPVVGPVEFHWRLAGWYEMTGDPGWAYYHYKVICERYAGTPLAGDARERMHVLWSRADNCMIEAAPRWPFPFIPLGGCMFGIDWEDLQRRSVRVPFCYYDFDAGEGSSVALKDWRRDIDEKQFRTEITLLQEMVRSEKAPAIPLQATGLLPDWWSQDVVFDGPGVFVYMGLDPVEPRATLSDLAAELLHLYQWAEHRQPACRCGHLLQQRTGVGILAARPGTLRQCQGPPRGARGPLDGAAAD
jgi:hypothetical protein